MRDAPPAAHISPNLRRLDVVAFVFTLVAQVLRNKSWKTTNEIREFRLWRSQLIQQRDVMVLLYYCCSWLFFGGPFQTKDVFTCTKFLISRAGFPLCICRRFLHLVHAYHDKYSSRLADSPEDIQHALSQAARQWPKRVTSRGLPSLDPQGT